MAFSLFDRVRIEHKNVTGDIVDIYRDDEGRTVYTVQSSKRGYVNDPDAYTGDFPLYDCTKEELTKL